MKFYQNKKVIIPAAAVFLILVATLTVFKYRPVDVMAPVTWDDVPNLGPKSVDYTYYNNYDEMNSRVDLVFIGEVVKVNDPKDMVVGYTTNTLTGQKKNVRDIYAVSEVRVDKVIKGSIKPGDIVKVKQMGGLYGVDYLKTGERHLLFLESYETVPSSPINPHQGNIPIVKGKLKKTNSLQFFKDGVSEEAVEKELKSRVEALNKE